LSNIWNHSTHACVTDVFRTFISNADSANASTYFKFLQKRAILAEEESEKSQKQIEELKKKHEMEISTPCFSGYDQCNI